MQRDGGAGDCANGQIRVPAPYEVTHNVEMTPLTVTTHFIRATFQRCCCGEPEDANNSSPCCTLPTQRNLLDAEALAMMEGVIQASERQVSEDHAAARTNGFITSSEPPEQFIPFVSKPAHSRFLSWMATKTNIIGILSGQWILLRYYAGEEFEVRGHAAPAVFVPESKRLNVCCATFAATAITSRWWVDEYAVCASMVTIEDVLEQIVGEIEDEYDLTRIGHIIPVGKAAWRIKRRRPRLQILTRPHWALAAIQDEEYDTRGWSGLRQPASCPNGASVSHRRP